MKSSKTSPHQEIARLRRRAEDELLTRSPGGDCLPELNDMKRLCQELQIHQIELELQNNELRQIRDELEITLEKYTELYDFAPVSYFTLDQEGVILSANLTGAGLLKIGRSMLIGRSFKHFIAVDDRSRFTTFLQRVMTRRIKETCEFTLQKKGRHPFVVQVMALTVADTGAFLMAVIDVSERKWTEYLLERSEKQLLVAQETAHIGSWKLESVLFTINGSAEFFRIFDAVFTTYKEFLNLVHPDDRDKVNSAVLDVFKTQQPYMMYFRIFRPDGTIRTIQGQGEVIADAAGTADLMIGTIQDVTGRSQHEDKILGLNAEINARDKKLADAYFELEAFKYTVSRDLVPHLACITSASRVTGKSNNDNFRAPTRESMEKIGESVAQMNALVKTLLGFSDVTHVEMRRDEVDLSALANSVAEELSQGADECHVEFLVADGIRAHGDAELLRIVQRALICNAWSYAGNREGAVIGFGKTEFDGRPVYFVCDNGPGFDAALVGKLFVPFQCPRGSEKARSHGIGLATAERIINSHGGKLWAEQDPVKGACYYYTLSN